VTSGEAPVVVDGRFGEGGGSILRLATGLSCLTGRAVSIDGIRQNRPRPGLAPQHLTGLRALAELFNAQTQGLELGSTRISFAPGSSGRAKLEVDVGTAGSIGLMLQGLMIGTVIGGRKTEISLTGGTHVPWSPSFDYLKNVTLVALGEMGYDCHVEMEQPGYYPKGGGRVSFTSTPCQYVKPIRLDSFGELSKIEGVSRASNLPEHVARRQASAAASALSELGQPRIDTSIEGARCPGSAITLWASTTAGGRLGASSLGRRGKPAEEVGSEAGEELRSYLVGRSPVDPYLLDQILPYCAVARGTSVLKGFKLTSHATTNIHVIRKFLDCQIKVDGEAPCIITVEGSGMKEGSAVG
jgi:RNA 3'-phosphate cyclase